MSRTALVPALLMALTLCAAIPASGADTPALGDIIIEDGYQPRFDPDGSWSLRDVRLSHGRDTRITAQQARGVDKPGGRRELTLTGKVHIEFRDAVLDSDSAFLVLQGDRVASVSVKGSQATFSHQLSQSQRRIDGRANDIDYVASTGKVRFSGDTSFTDGRNQLATNLVIYDINNGSVGDDGDPETRVRGVFRAGESGRIAPPNPPARETAE